MTDRPSADALWYPPPAPADPDGVDRPRIAVVGLGIESSTFSPHRAGHRDFTILRGDDVRRFHPFLDPETPLGRAADWIGAYRARSIPGGAVLADVYDTMRDDLTTALAELGEVDGVYVDLHGAMSVVGMDDAEADLCAAIRRTVGPDALIGASMDLHGNLSTGLLDALDLVTCYRMAPHEDVLNTRHRAASTLVERLRGPLGRDVAARRPALAWVPVPILLPGERTSTRLEPAAGLYRRVAETADRADVIDAAMWMGYPWADEPRCRAGVVVMSDDPETASRAATDLAEALWAARDAFEFVAPVADLSTCLDRALAPGAARPYVISDSGDNPTAGGTGDVTWTLTRLLADPRLADAGRTVIVASVFDAEAVAACAAAGVGVGVGATVSLAVGARVDRGPAGPARIEGVVHSLTDGDPVGGRIAVIRAGAVHAIVTERRKPFHLVADFTDLDLDPHEADVVVVKIGYLEPELYALAADWSMALTPGGVDQDLTRLGHHRIHRPMYPFDEFAVDPDLTPRLLGPTTAQTRTVR